MAASSAIIPPETIERAILMLRGQKVMLDKDLATLYGVGTKVLIQAVKRNLSRFPADFLFQLSWEEADRLRSQFVTLNETAAETSTTSMRGRHRKFRPYAFTEQGVAMLSSVLRSERAVLVNIEIMGPLCGCGKSWPPTLTWPASSTRWRRSTTPSSKRCSTRFGN